MKLVAQSVSPPSFLAFLAPPGSPFLTQSGGGRKTVINRGVISTSPHAMTKRAKERARQAFGAFCPNDGDLCGLDECSRLSLCNLCLLLPCFSLFFITMLSPSGHAASLASPEPTSKLRRQRDVA